MKKIYPFLVSAVLWTLVLSGCGNKQTGSVDREELFTLGIGPMEDQIALYNLQGGRGIRRTGFTMRDGLFYIADGNGGKIVRYNSYGDLLFMIYNEETNPEPFSLKINVTEDEQAIRWAHSYPLEEPGWIAVDSRKHIFVEDRMPVESHRIDTDTKALLDGVILHFDQDGRFINYIGREGLGGSPFPRIVGLSTSASDELAVICRIPDGWNIYWYNSSLMLIFLVKITSADIPSLADWPEALYVIDSISASCDSRKLFIKADYSINTYDQSTNIYTGSEPLLSVVWTLNVEDGSYSDSVEIPLFELVEDRGENPKAFYSMLGAMRGGKALLYFPVDTGYSLLFADTVTGEQRRGYIQFTNDELRYNDFFLSADGILTAMLADSYNVKMVWWLTARFMGETQ